MCSKVTWHTWNVFDTRMACGSLSRTAEQRPADRLLAGLTWHKAQLNWQSFLLRQTGPFKQGWVWIKDKDRTDCFHFAQFDPVCCSFQRETHLVSSEGNRKAHFNILQSIHKHVPAQQMKETLLMCYIFTWGPFTLVRFSDRCDTALKKKIC